MFGSRGEGTVCVHPISIGSTSSLFSGCRKRFCPPQILEPRFRTARLQTDSGAALEGERSGSGNSSMILLVNGERVLVRGSSLVPLDTFNGRTSLAATKRMLISVAGANMNALRIWGGGMSFAYSPSVHAFHTRRDRVASSPFVRRSRTKSPPLGPGRALSLICGWDAAGTFLPPMFYELCDELGIMLLHDFMLSWYPNIPYPAFAGPSCAHSITSSIQTRQLQYIVSKSEHVVPEIPMLPAKHTLHQHFQESLSAEILEISMDALSYRSLSSRVAAAYRARIRLEVEQKLLGLARHPSIVLWFGGNEDQCTKYLPARSSWDHTACQGKNFYPDCQQVFDDCVSIYIDTVLQARVCVLLPASASHHIITAQHAMAHRSTP